MGIFDKIKEWDQKKRSERAQEKAVYDAAYKKERSRSLAREAVRKARSDARRPRGIAGAFDRIDRFGQSLDRMGDSMMGPAPRGSRRSADPMAAIYGSGWGPSPARRSSHKKRSKGREIHIHIDK